MPAVSNKLGGHSLIDGALCARVDQKGEVGVAVDIDEARGYDKALGVDLVFAPGLIEGAYDLDFIVHDANVRYADGTA